MPQSYDTGVTTDVSKSGTTSAFIKSKVGIEEIEGFGTLMQQFSPGKYLGRRIMLSGYVKSENIDQWAGLWMRVDGRKGGSSLAFDNMMDRPITGSTEWERYEVVLDVAVEAGNIAFGFLLSGTGALWADGLTIEEVSENKPVTGSTRTPQNTPQNLDFEN
jgi:hypothetical protein